MERGSCVGGGMAAAEMRLPIGFRFRPTDEELLVHYLKRKALSLPLPASVILDFDVFSSHPTSLPGDLKERRRYYFCTGKGNNFIATGCGFWKTSGKSKQILASCCDDGYSRVVGIRKSWSFYQKETKTGSHGHGWSRTPWVIHEFQLVRSAQDPDGPRQDWAVCRVFQRRKKPNKQHGSAVSGPLKCFDYGGGFERPTYIDFMLEENSSDSGPPQPPSPTCSIETMGVVSNSSRESALPEHLTN